MVTAAVDSVEMDLTLSAEQSALAAFVAEFLARHWDATALLHGDSNDPAAIRDLWRRATTQFGLTELGRPGADLYDLMALTVVAEQWGGSVAPGPLLTQAAIISPVLGAAAEHHGAAAEHLAAVDAGELVIAPVPDLTIDLASPHGDRISLDLPRVHDGMLADALLVRCAVDGGTRWALVSLEGPGVEREPLVALDLAAAPAAIRVVDAPLTVFGTAPDGDLPLAAMVILAAEFVGIADAAMRAAIAHVTQREQFDRPVASFQAVKHRLARVLVATEAARSVVRCGAIDVMSAPTSRATREHVFQAVQRAARSASGATADLIGLLGGIGFTWEHPAHLLYRRARYGRALLGGEPAWSRELEGML